MEAAPSAKPRRGSPPIPPNYVSLRQLQELRLKEKEEQEKRQREEEAAAAAVAAAVAEREAARKAEMEAMAAAAIKRDAERNRFSAVVSVGPVRAKERRDGGGQGRDCGLGPQWVAVAHRPAAPPPARREAVPEAVPIGAGRGNKGPADAPRGGGKPEGKAKGDGKGKVSAISSAEARTADEPGKPIDASSQGRKPENKGEGKGKAKAKAFEDTSVEPGSIGGSGESAGASSRRRKNPKGKKGARGRSAEPSADSASPKTASGATPPQPQGVKPEENTGKPKSAAPKRADASPVSDSSHGKKADATPPPPTLAAAGGVSELRITAETKPEGLVEGRRRPPAVEVKGAAEQKPRVVTRRTWPRPAGDRWCNGTGEQHDGLVWVPKAGGVSLR